MIHQALHEQTRSDIGKSPSPTVAIIDSQSVKTTELADSRGFNAHKKVKGRKRHIVTDTIGIPLGVKVTDANVSDNRVAIELLNEVFSWQITIQLVCADAGYRGELGDWLYLTHQCQLDIAPSLGQSGFVVVPLRWIVERTFSWFGWFRRRIRFCILSRNLLWVETTLFDVIILIGLPFPRKSIKLSISKGVSTHLSS